MRYFAILRIYLKRTIRDRIFILIMIIFPIALIWVLGNAFTGIIGNENDQVVNANMLYTIKDQSAISTNFETYMIADENNSFSFTIEDDYDKAIDLVRKNLYDAYIIVSENKIELFKNSVYNFNGTMAEMILSAYVDQYNITYEIINTDPSILSQGNTNNANYTKVIAMTKDREPGSMDYYGVTITSMFIFYGLIFISTYIIGEKRLKTKDRILISPVKSVTYQWGVISGNVIILLLQTLFLIFLGIVVFNTYWGDNLLIPIGILTAELIMVSSLGALLGMLIDSESVVSGISQLLIPVFVFLGDGYVQLPSTGIFGVIKKFSPLYWVNHSIFNAIYSNDYSDAYIAIIICLSIAVISTVIIAVHRRSRRVANA